MTDQKRVLITGASDGIGLLVAERFIKAGHAVIGIGRRHADMLPANFPMGVAYHSVDMADAQVASKMTAILLDAGWDSLDHLILNAGTGKVCNPSEELPDAIAATLAINLNAPIAIAHGLYPWLERKNGRVTLIGSVAHKGAPNFASYAASKAGLNGFARALQQEWKSRVGVQIIHLGPVATDMHKKAGLKLGWQRKLFLSPDFAARKIVQLVQKDKPFAKLSFGAREADRLTGLIKRRAS